ncbi:MAG: putative DNA binding domain-containing protein [Candidatus Obscuribacterales bacterium]|nr:putative DNA binding domain-containing protein [Candidatus Obscuribacterales bacterium]
MDGYLVWGIQDQTKAVVGTTFKPDKGKGNQSLEMWLVQRLSPKPDFQFRELTYNGQRMIVLCIRAVAHMPVRWDNFAFIRVGSHESRLDKYPEKEKQLWLKCARVSFEDQVISEQLGVDEVLQRLDYPAYFDLLKQPLPDKSVIVDRLKREKLIGECAGGRYEITALGGLLFAKNMEDFPTLQRKSIRVIIYKGSNKVEGHRERTIEKGYAAGFGTLMLFINDQLPTNELIGQAFRKEQKMYPELAIRELVANALLHQDLHSVGNGPLVEIYLDRIEITNPGIPLIDTLRFIDEPPQSRNEGMASLMRRLNMCEERGSGIDKVVFHVELFQLPAPEFLVTENHTKAVLFAYKPLNEMSKEDKIRACYQHACLCYVSNKEMSNSTLRERFGIEDKNSAIASRIIGDTVDSKLIRPHDPSSNSRKHSRYVPYWAASTILV